MSRPVGDEHAAFSRWFTGELRAGVGELTQRPYGDFCTDLADWLIAAGRVPRPSDTLARDRDRELASLQRDQAWRDLTVLDGMLRAAARSGPAGAAPPASPPAACGPTAAEV